MQAFNTTLKNFMEELADVFPEEAQIRVFLEGLDALVALTPRAPMDMFVESLAPHSQLLMTKSPDLFDQLVFPGGIDFAKLWTTDISDNTRNAIWEYLHLLFLLGNTVRAIPTEMLQGIETVAQQCADQMQSGNLDFAALGSMLMNGGLANLAGGNLLGAVGGDGGGDGGGDNDGGGGDSGDGEAAASSPAPASRRIGGGPRLPGKKRPHKKGAQPRK